jgi:uncharacterized protein (UPF0261 family)
MAVVLIGTLDTKGDEVDFARGVLRAQGLETIVIDAGSLGPVTVVHDVSRVEVFRAAGTSAEAVRQRGDRGEAVAAAARGVTEVVKTLAVRGQVEAVLGLGGSAGTVIGTAAMRALPLGVPKVMVSTLASGQTRSFVGGSDVLMLYPVADLAGLNRLTRTALANAALAVAGMVRGQAGLAPDVSERPLVTATMFGVTTPCVDRARRALEASGCEVIVFHATGVGGQSMEGLVRDGRVQGVLDLTTTELADELVGGILTAGPERLEAAVRAGVPQVVSVGALDMVNFGPMSTVPERFAGRRFHVHNESVTLMRTTAEENATLGAWMARVLARATAQAVLMLPLRGVSALDAEGMPFHDPAADRALFDALAAGLAGAAEVTVDARDEHINDPAFADAAARHLLKAMAGKKGTGGR